MFSARSVVLIVALAALPVASSAQSCAAADAILGSSKSKPKFKSSYDKFADSTTLSTQEGIYKFKTSNAYIAASIDLKHAGTADGPLVSQLHFRGGLWWDHGVPQPIPPLFSDSAVVTLLADTARTTLHATGHKAPVPLSLVTTAEDLYVALTPAQLESMARAKTAALRLVDKGTTYDMAVVGDFKQVVISAYRADVCSPSYATK